MAGTLLPEDVFAVLKQLFFIQLFASVTLVAVMYRYPLLLFRLWQRWLIFRTGFKLKKLKVGDNFQYEYMEKGDPKDCSMSVLLVHGFSSSKDSWCTMGYHFPRRAHILAFDLPGHGGTTRKEKEDCSIVALAGRVNQFVDAVGMNKGKFHLVGTSMGRCIVGVTAFADAVGMNKRKFHLVGTSMGRCIVGVTAFVDAVGMNKRKFHLVGTSMGGCIVGVTAAIYPQNLLSLTMICPIGINAPQKSKIFEIYEKEQRVVMLPNTDDEFIDMIGLLVHKPVKFPRIIVTGVMQARKQAQSFYENMLREIMSERDRFILEEKLEEIKTPTLVIWGKEDQCLHVSSLDVIKEKRPDFKFEVIEECGHSIALERPRKLANIIVSFLNEF